MISKKETPLTFGRDIQTDTLAYADMFGTIFGSKLQMERCIAVEKIGAVERPVDIPLAAELSRAFTAFSSQRSNQHRPWCAIYFSDDIETEVHAVDEVNVCKTGRSEHNAAALGNSSVGVTGRIVLRVCFHFHNRRAQNFTARQGAHQNHAKQVRRDFNSRPRKELTGQFFFSRAFHN